MTSIPGGPVPLSVHLRVALRSFCLQASWNFERLQNLGFLYVLLPGLRYLHGEAGLASACSRHLAYFNTHPYLASSIIGASLHMEADVAQGRAPAENLDEFKKMVMAPYAAMGDAFFWGGMRPLAAIIALFFAFRGSLWAPAVFLFTFNLPHLLFRIMGLRRGLALGLGVIHVIQAHRLPDLAMKAKEASVILLGGLAAVITLDTLRGEELGDYWGCALLPLVLCFVWLSRHRMAPLVLIYLSTGLLLTMTLLMS